MNIADIYSDNRIFICPKCGATKLTRTQLLGDDLNLCPYCGHELIDLSLEKQQAEIADVLEKKKRVLSIPAKVALIIGTTLLVLFLVTACVYMFGINRKANNVVVNSGPNYYTSQMKKAYEKGDYDKLYELVIEKCDKSISSSWYFAYRTAWYLNTFPAAFDIAIADGDYDKASEYYRIMREDYLQRNDFFDNFYDSIPEIEEQLKAEYQRETDIMKEHDLL